MSEKEVTLTLSREHWEGIGICLGGLKSLLTGADDKVTVGIVVLHQVEALETFDKVLGKALEVLP